MKSYINVFCSKNPSYVKLEYSERYSSEDSAVDALVELMDTNDSDYPPYYRETLLVDTASGNREIELLDLASKAQEIREEQLQEAKEQSEHESFERWPCLNI